MNTYKDKYGLIRASYHNGQLVTVELTSKCDKVQFDGVKHSLEFFEEDLPETWKKQRSGSVKEKIALFCIGYKAWSLKTTGTELDYKPSRVESGMIKNVKVDEHLLRAFLLTDFWTKEKTISNYVKHYNEIQRIAATKSSKGQSAGYSEMGEAFSKFF